MNIETLLVRAGVERDSTTGAISTPIYQSATFQHPELGVSTGYDYSRTANPTRTALEEAIAALEQGARGFAFSSGMAAITTVLFLFKPGDHLVVSEDLYGGTYRLLAQVFSEFGIQASFVDTSCTKEIEAAIRPDTRALFIETPTNPLMKITDLEKAVVLARTYGLLTIIDNTFMTPYLQRPLTYGADIVLHSATKYLGGHNDTVAGLVVTRDAELGERIGLLQNACGAILGPQDAWLILRGLKTLAIRIEKQQQNALAIAEWLQRHSAVETVYYPGLSGHPNREVAERQASGFGGMLSFSVHDPDIVPHVLKNVKVITFAESLGGVESLITFPARQTHADIPKEVREHLGITDRLLRLSVGIENANDLILDLEEALYVKK
jgi:cystathionine gamma-synthase